MSFSFSSRRAMDEQTLILILAGALTFVFGWNNSSILIGNERGSGTLSARESVILCSVGIILGVALEGSRMRGSLGGTVAGQVTDTMVIATLVVSTVLNFGLTLAAIPVSFSNTMVGAFAGAAIASSLPLRAANLGTILGFWVVAPVATMAVTFLSYKVIERGTRNMSLLSVDAFNRAGVSLVSLAVAFVLSANNIGLIYGTAFTTRSASVPLPAGSTSLLIIVGLGVVAIVAMALFGRGAVAGTVGDRLLSLSPQGVLAAFTGTIIMMFIATQFSIPISVSQCLLGGMYGAAFTKRIAIVNGRLTMEVFASWVAIPLAAFAMAAVLTPFL
jgi:PiT family inorganic phosphate transporter